VLIPALNEELGIGPTINDLNSKLGNQRILLIDGNSCDNTVKIAKDSGVEVLFQKGKGKGPALYQGLKHTKLSADYIILIDADYTYPAKEIPIMIEILNENPKVGMVTGNRLNKSLDRKNLSGLIHLGNKLLSLAHNLLNGINLQDPLTGLRVIRAEILKNWSLESKGFDIEIELNLLVKRKGYSIAEVPIEYRPRKGEKKLKIKDGMVILQRIIKESVNLKEK
jgi:dolichol-phosphate mannosyltransferase